MTDLVVTHSNVLYRRPGATRREQNPKPYLREAAPAMLQDVSFQQQALSILELKQVLDDKRVP